MVEFVRDVVIVVALLVTLMAVAFSPMAESDVARNSMDQRSTRMNVPGPTPRHAEPIVAPASKPDVSAH